MRSGYVRPRDLGVHFFEAWDGLLLWLREAAVPTGTLSREDADPITRLYAILEGLYRLERGIGDGEVACQTLFTDVPEQGVERRKFQCATTL